MKRFIGGLLSVLFVFMGVCGFFFTYAMLVYWLTDGAMCGKFGVLLMLIASVASAFGLMFAVVKWGE